MDDVVWFHTYVLWFITAITLFVLALLVYRHGEVQRARPIRRRRAPPTTR